MKIIVDAYALNPPSVMAGVRGSRGSEYLDFDFDSIWDGYAKTVVFVMADGSAVERRYRGEPLAIPEEIFCHRGKSHFAVVGKKGKRRRMSVMGELLVLNSPQKALGEEEGNAE